MDDINGAHGSDRLLAGALAHLAQHLEHNCPRAAYLAGVLLTQVAADPLADALLRQHAQDLAETLASGTIPSIDPRLATCSSPGSLLAARRRLMQ